LEFEGLGKVAMFSFEKMLAWQKAADWSDKVLDAAEVLPQRMQSSFGDQLRRSCLSVTNNLAEGSGKRTPASQRQYYDIAHGSAYETMSILAMLKRRKVITLDEYQQMYIQGDEVASLIYRLLQATLNATTLKEDTIDYEVDRPHE
jgi:four helix bundle protein